MQKFCVIFFFLFVLQYNAIYTKDHKNFVYTCADKDGPVLEFSVPNFKQEELKKEIPLKFFESNNEDSFITNGIIEKKNSPIDYSYTFYLIKILKIFEKNKISQIEFFPPSHMIVTKNKSFSESLVCWD